MQLAKGLRMEFSNKGDRALLKQLKPLWRFRRGRHSRPKNILTENKSSVDFTFFESRKTTRTGSSNHSGQRVLEDIFCFRSDDLNLPTFALHIAEELQQMFLNLLGFKDINFDGHPEFSRKYLLNSDDERAVRAFFDDATIRFLENLDGFHIEGCGQQLLIYRPEVRIEPGEFKQLKRETGRILAQFRAKSSA